MLYTVTFVSSAFHHLAWTCLKVFMVLNNTKLRFLLNKMNMFLPPNRCWCYNLFVDLKEPRFKVFLKVAKGGRESARVKQIIISRLPLSRSPLLSPPPFNHFLIIPHYIHIIPPNHVFYHNRLHLPTGWRLTSNCQGDTETNSEEKCEGIQWSAQNGTSCRGVNIISLWFL